jgi:diaminohydroxyphosphoribosylaminopyrimidine deaminase/5-amino-6-(5-phosphoribosylamino)uracil reductase
MSSRAWVHRRRREADAILVGANTVRHDNPALTTRMVRGKSPDRFVVDSKLSVSAKARVWSEDGARRVAVTTESAPENKRRELQACGVEVWALPADADGRVLLRAFAEKLGEEGYTNLLAEGGGVLAGALFASHLVDVAWVMAAPHLLLGGGGPGWTEGLRVPAVSRGLRIAHTDFRRIGPDWLVTLVPESAQWWAPEVIHA